MDKFNPSPKSPPTPVSPESDQVRIELREWIEKFIAEIKAGHIGFGFHGKTNTSITNKAGEVFPANDNTSGHMEDFHAIPYEGIDFKKLERANYNMQTIDAKGLGSIRGLGRGILTEISGTESKPAQLIFATAISDHVQDGTKEEKYEEVSRGFLGKEKRVTKIRQVPNIFKKPMLLSNLNSHGAEEPAYAIFLKGKAGGYDHVGRPFDNKFIFICPKRTVEEIFGTSTHPGGLLKRNPNLLAQVIKGEAPELWEDFKKGMKDYKRQALVVVDNFSSVTFSAGTTEQDLVSLFRNQRLSGNIIEYTL
jgi:hypothetical protein